MSDHDHADGGQADHHEPGAARDHHEYDPEERGRITSPMRPFTAGEAGKGFVVLAVGVALAYLLPFLAGAL